METAFFRFSSTEDKQKVYRTQLTIMLLSTLVFSCLLFIFKQPIADFINTPEHPEYVGWCAVFIALDTLAALPYARLRQENRPRKYAVTKILGIVVFVGSIVFLYSFAGKWAEQSPQSFFGQWYFKHNGVGFILFANILQSAATLILLFKELADYKPQLDIAVLKKVLWYGFPILIAGFAGTINDTLNRVMFQKMYPVSEAESLRMVGIYTAAVRLAILINFTIQAFKMAAEPFFFSISKDSDAQHTYARVMKWFVILLALMFLCIMLYLDIWKFFVGPAFRDALSLVPVLLLGYMFLGIYYNLTIWYKLTDKTHFGALIMVIGAAVTIAFNWLLIPTWGYAACAWGTLFCYGIMMMLSYLWGQKYYPVPYQVKKLAAYFAVMLSLYFIQWGISQITSIIWLRLLTGTVLMFAFLRLIMKMENKELKRFPVIGKWIK